MNAREYERIENQWVDRYGEAVTKSVAADMLGVCRWSIYKMIQSGALRETPYGKILVRQACAFANGVDHEEEEA